MQNSPTSLFEDGSAVTDNNSSGGEEESIAKAQLDVSDGRPKSFLMS
jgi:hypothetical protein